MYSGFQLTVKYLRYYFTASNGKGHGIHSPFVFAFVRDVLNDKTRYEAYAVVESLRRRLLKDQTLLEVQDLGAGSSGNAQAQRKVAGIARHAAKPAKYGQLLFRIVRYFEPQHLIELGTSLGITTAYLAMANQHAQVITVEGAPQVATLAVRNFQQLSLHNVQCREGGFDAVLPGVLETVPAADLVFIDGNHRKAATLEYFHALLKKTHPASVLVFDDIHWSREMEEAWEEVKAHPRVTATIDLFFIGLVFFRKEFRSRQHFVIRY